MGTEEVPPPPPGWFDDPDGRAGVKRYWDGADWTDEYDSGTEQYGSLGAPQSVPEVKKQFASLRTIAVLFRILGWLTLVGGSIAVIVTAINATANGASAAVFLITGGLGVAIYALMFFAFSAFIYLMISVEETNRRTAAAVEGLVAQRR